MISNKVASKIQERYKAFLHLLDICVYHGVDENSISQYRVPSAMAFFNLAGGQITQDREGFILTIDSGPISFQKTNGGWIHVVFIPSKPGGGNISKNSLMEPLKKFLIDVNQAQMIPKDKSDLTPDALISIIQGNKNSPLLTIDFDMQLILYSEEKIESSTYNTLVNYNEKIKNPIKHFTIGQLQYDPTKHITGPRVCRVLMEYEVDDLITRQIGLRGEYGIDDLGEEYLKRIEEFEDNPIERMKAKEELREYVLTKLPTANSTDPWVKWRGFKIGDVIYIERRIGPTPICYRRIVKLDKEVYSESERNAGKVVKQKE